MRFISATLSLLLVVCLSGCRVDSMTDPIIIPDVEREFTIDMLEILDIGDNLLTLQIKTIRNENCLNTGIDYSLRQSGNQVGISLNKISPPLNCQPGSAPAQASINFEKLTLGNFDFSIDLLQTITNEGTLVNGASAYRLNMKTENGIQVLHNELLKIPENTIWGWISYSGSTQQAAAGALTDISLLSSGRSFDQGYYGYFEINEDQLSIRQSPEDQVFLPVLTNIKPENIAALQELLQHYRREYQPEQLSIQLTNWQGQIL